MVWLHVRRAVERSAYNLKEVWLHDLCPMSLSICRPRNLYSLRFVGNQEFARDSKRHVAYVRVTDLTW
jgi:hypothetical protein